MLELVMFESSTVGANGKRVVPSLVLMESVLFHPTRREQWEFGVVHMAGRFRRSVEGGLTPHLRRLSFTSFHVSSQENTTTAMADRTAAISHYMPGITVFLHDIVRPRGYSLGWTTIMIETKPRRLSKSTHVNVSGTGTTLPRVTT